MNIVYLIGNGFDLKLGMRTKYAHFYEYLKHIKNLPDSVDNLIMEIEKKPENWSDFESGLGKYLKNIKLNEAVELHRNIVRLLSGYISSVEEKYDLTADKRFEFGYYLINPHNGTRLFWTDEIEVNNYIAKWVNHPFKVQIITFNYTRSIEKLLGHPNTIDRKWSEESRVKAITDIKIEHIHGLANKGLILGVNDPSQILNDELSKNSKIVDRYVKSACNDTYRTGHVGKCENWLKDADLICIFGLSLGDTDKKWWELVGETLKRDCRVIIFEHDTSKKFDGNQGPDIKEAEEAVKDKFLSKTNLEEEIKSKVRKKIYVTYTAVMFDFGEMNEIYATTQQSKVEDTQP